MEAFIGVGDLDTSASVFFKFLRRMKPIFFQKQTDTTIEFATINGNVIG
jgi:hypothetical protein